MRGLVLYGLTTFLAGFVVGVSCSPAQHGLPTVGNVQSDYEQLVAQAEEEFGKEVGDFVAQFRDFRVVAKTDRLLVGAAADGRFVIRTRPDNELVASELRYPMEAGQPDQLVRHYELGSEGKRWYCTFGRTADGAKLLEVHFGFTDDLGHGLAYVDADADGRWDRLIERTSEGYRFYRREGLLWKESRPEK